MVEYWVGASGDYLQRLVDNGVLSPREPVLEIGSSGEILRAFGRLLDRIRDNPPALARLMAAHLMEILAVVSSSARPAPPLVPATRTSDDPLVAEALRLIWNHSEPRPIRVSQLVAELPVTRRSLERRFRRSLGTTILQEIARCRMERAKRLLEQTPLPIKHVAAAAGFSHEDRMFEAFRRLEGTSPDAYRHRHRAALRPRRKKENGK